MFSKSCQYALQAVMYIGIASRNKKAVGLQEIAKSQEIPHHFLSKILQELVKKKVLTSIKGPNGGFSLLKSPKKLYLIKIVEIMDGMDIFDRCGMGLKKCSDQTPCPIHAQFKLVKQDIKQLLSTKSVYELSDDVENGLAIISL